MAYTKVDQRALARSTWEMANSESPEVQEAVARLQLAAIPSEEGNKAWANIVFDMQEPIRSGILDEDTVSDIFLVERLGQHEIVDYSLDFYQNTDRSEYWAYTLPDHGNLPQRYASAGSVQFGTYRIGNAIDFWIRYLKTARWNVLRRGMEVYRNGYVKKINSDGWNTLMAAMYYRNVIIDDEFAQPNQITPRLISLMQVFMKRDGGGNMGSNGFVMTDLYVSPEAAASMRSWDLSLVPEKVREQIFSSGSGTPLAGLFDITIHQHDDLGVGQPLQELFLKPQAEGGFGGALPPGRNELVIGMDRRDTGAFAKMPVREPGIETYADDSSYTLRSQTRGIFGWMESTPVVLENKFVLLGAF